MDGFSMPEFLDILVRILAAAGLGGILGLERDMHARWAGLRTHLLVSTGAALFTVLSARVPAFGVAEVEGFTIVTDPGRIAAQIVTGIGFLGAGVIIKEGFTIRGLTTAACLWIAAAIGMASGAGFFATAVLTTLIALFALIFLRRLERLYPKDTYRDFLLSVPNDADISQIRNLVEDKDVKILFYGLDRNYQTGVTSVKMSLRFFSKDTADGICEALLREFETKGLPLKSATWFQP